MDICRKIKIYAHRRLNDKIVGKVLHKYVVLKQECNGNSIYQTSTFGYVIRKLDGGLVRAIISGEPGLPDKGDDVIARVSIFPALERINGQFYRDLTRLHKV